MTNKNKATLYIGVTNDLVRRVNQHKKHLIKNSYTDKYNLEYCIYYEEFEYFDLAIYRGGDSLLRCGMTAGSCEGKEAAGAAAHGTFISQMFTAAAPAASFCQDERVVIPQRSKESQNITELLVDSSHIWYSFFAFKINSTSNFFLTIFTVSTV